MKPRQSRLPAKLPTNGDLEALVARLPVDSGYCKAAPGHPFHGPYHDEEYGFRATEDSVIFERLTLEVFQAGLSWLICLKKRPGFRKAFAGYDIDRVAAFGEPEIANLLTRPEIIRHRGKIEATIHNARELRRLRDDHGTLVRWLDDIHPAPLAHWQKLMRKRFKFAGPEVVREFLASLGYLPDAHGTACPTFKRTIALGAPWAERPDSSLADHMLSTP